MSASALDVAVEAVRRASAVLRERAVGTVQDKGDRDLVTDLDRIVEDAVREFLAAETPTIGFLGEETGGDPSGAHWVLDPIDGTSNLVHGLPMYAVSLALVDGEQTTAAVIELPASGDRYTARRGGGAHGNGNPITASATSDLASAIVSVGDFAVGDGAPARNADRLALIDRLARAVERVRMLGSACTDLAWVACGRLDATVIPSNKPWDTAAGVLLAREAGAVVVDRRGEPHTRRSGNTVAMTPALRPALLDHVAE